jgi:hypothetical protein
MFRNIILFYGEELLAPRQTPKLEDHPLSAVRDCLFNVFTATLHNWRPFLHLQPENAPCRGDRGPVNTVYVQLTAQYVVLVPLHVSATNGSHIQGATIVEVTCSVLCNLPAYVVNYMQEVSFHN